MTGLKGSAIQRVCSISLFLTFVVSNSGITVHAGDPAIDPEQAQAIAKFGEATQYSASGGLFSSIAQSRMAALDADDTIARLKREPTTADIQLATVDVSALKEGVVRLNVAPGRMLESRSQKVDRDSAGTLTWNGASADGAENSIFVVRGANVTGSVRTLTELYSIRPVGGGVHAIIRVDGSKFPPEHPPEFTAVERAAAAAPPHVPGADVVADQERVLNVLVAYTPAVAAAVTDVDGMIQLALAEENLSFRNSGVLLQARLVYSYKTNYVETGNFDTDLKRFREPGDGVMDEVHALRQQYAADVCVVIINNTSYCGLASAILAEQKTAFAAVHYTCATGNLSFAHEIGHLQGARHNLEADPSTTPFAYGHGLYNAAGKWRTVMSYQCPANNCNRIPYWSNPGVSYGGASTGTAAQNNNARVLNETATIVTNFRPSLPLGAIGYAWANDPGSASYAPSAAYAYSSAGLPITITRSGKGLYAVKFAGLGGRSKPGGTVQVSGYGGANTMCKVGSWSSGGADFITNVRCYDAIGSLADSMYTVLVWWP